ncbi:MAG: branched-chain amino acid ABC transporter permease [Candidatus Rokubacteria bacterium]|nr:branched-chain amino acid ABC transporter permease [Candidatus Rokubacteria bacterium]
MMELALQQVVNGLMVGAIYAVMALGLMVILGILGVINMAQGELYMLGGYFSYFAIALLGVDYFTSIGLAMLLTAAAGVVLERVAVRPLRGRPFFTVFLSTFAASMMLQDLVQILWTPDPREIPSPFALRPIVIGPLFLTTQRIFIFVLALALVVGFAAFLRFTRAGMAIRALAKDRDAALLMGVNAERMHMLTFALGSALAAAAGALLGAMFNVYPTMGELPLLKGFALVIMGGMGSVGGVFVSGLILGVAEGLTAGFFATGWVDVVAFGTLIVVLLFRPEGLSSWGRSRG